MRHMTNIEFVYFDLDDTLLDHKYAEKRALQELVANQSKLFNHTSFEKVVELYSVINPDVWHKYSAGVYSKDEAKIGRFQLKAPLKHL
jgi:FMN phosphatase YigB (HAD superfamily)